MSMVTVGRGSQCDSEYHDSDIGTALCHYGHKACCEQGPVYLSGLWRPLGSHETMSNLGIDGLRPFMTPAQSDVVPDKNGWAQGALNADGTLKDSSDIDLTEPGSAPPEEGPSPRPARSKDTSRLMKEAIELDKETSSDQEQRPAANPTDKGKDKQQDLTDPEDDEYSGSGLDDSGSDTRRQPSFKDSPRGKILSCQGEASETVSKPRKKKQKTAELTRATQNSSESLDTAEPETAVPGAQVFTFTMDNATNNDTLVEAFERMCAAKTFNFRPAIPAFGACLTQFISPFFRFWRQSVPSRRAPKTRRHRFIKTVNSVCDSPELDEAAVNMDDEDNEGQVPVADGIKASVRKLRTVIRAVRSGPQRRRQWYNIFNPAKIVAGVHMLILDTRTRWSSTHQLISQVLKYRAIDWDAISLVSDWLFQFRSATNQMSTTSRPMLPSTHSTFRSLQKTLKDKLAALPDDAAPDLVEGLTKAHLKPSKYDYKYDQSPFCIWATHYANDPGLAAYLEVQKIALHEYLERNYPAELEWGHSDGIDFQCRRRVIRAVWGLDQGSDDDDTASAKQNFSGDYGAI
ncbi:Transposase-like protein [Mycena venus]|uniref:Transposase-like protein n=1 Tax=Mycena venus TaxID=2733690 RepID=A0A8H6Z6N8_9AGAR|nr:Transposase-like protein [Mycena venus]